MRNIIFALSFLILPLGSLSAQNGSLRGSPSSMIKQNRVADKEDLTRLKDNAMIKRFVKSGLLVPLVDGDGIVVDRRLEVNRRFCRPKAVEFLKDLGTRFEREFHRPLQVNSCVRDIETQKALRWFNRNAAPTSGDKASAHLTGSAVDIARLGLTSKEQSFVDSRLKYNERAGKIEATKEHMQAVWHVMVFKKYGGFSEKKKK